MARVGSNPERPSLLSVQIIGMGLEGSLLSAYQDLLRKVSPRHYPHDSEPLGTRGRPQRHKGVHRQREPSDRHRHRRALRLSAGASRTMDDDRHGNGYPRERHPEPRLLRHVAWLAALLARVNETKKSHSEKIGVGLYCSPCNLRNISIFDFLSFRMFYLAVMAKSGNLMSRLYLILYGWFISDIQ